MQLPDGAVEAILERWPVASLATVGEDGRPHLVPIVFARSAGAIWSPVDGKPKRGGVLARIRNIRRDPRVSLLFEHYEPDWARLWWLRAGGDAEVRIANDPGENAEEAAAVAALRLKYPQYERVPVLGPEATLLRIRVTARQSWCASSEAVSRLVEPSGIEPPTSALRTQRSPS